MPIGSFSLSLAVEDLAASRRFYETLGFSAPHDSSADGWLMMTDGAAVIGLFQGHIPANTLTFNPGWTGMAEPVEGEWEDVRALQARLEEAGIGVEARCDPDGSGPAHILIRDPDDNPILIDQHR